MLLKFYRFIFFCTMFFLCILNKQDACSTLELKPPEIEWQKTFRGDSSNVARAIQQTTDGGYIVAGVIWYYGGGNWDFWVIKLNSKGNKIWDKTFGEKGGDQANAIQQTTDGGYIVAGRTGSYGAGDFDFWVIKLDSNGNKIWDKTFGNYANNANAIQQTTDGGYIVTGYTHGAVDMDLWVIKLDSNGNKIWDKTFGEKGGDQAHAIQQTTDGGYIVVGDTRSYGAGNPDLWVIKLDSEGNKIWDKTFGGEKEDEANAIQQTTDGGYIVAGLTNSYGAGQRDFWVIKLDSNGDKLWDKTFGGENEDEANAVQQTTDGGYIVAGGTESYGAGRGDFWVIKLAPEKGLKPAEAVPTKQDRLDTVIQPYKEGLKPSNPKLPPSLIASVKFTDENDNNFLDAEETGKIIVNIANKGAGEAYNVIVDLKIADCNVGTSSCRKIEQSGNETIAKYLKYETVTKIGTISPNTEKKIEIPITANEEIPSSEIQLTIKIAEANGFDAEPVKLNFSTRALKPPEIILSDWGIADANKNGKVELGELCDLTIRLKNTGAGRAENVLLKLAKTDNNLFLQEENGFILGDILIGESKDVTVTVFANTRFDKETMDFKLSVTEKRGKFGKGFEINIPINHLTQKITEVTITGKEEKQKAIEASVPSLRVDVDENIPKSKDKNPDAIAVIFGVEDYKKVSPVNYAKRDAAIFRDYAVNVLGIPDSKNNIYFLTEDVTLAEFRKAFTEGGWLSRRMKETSNVYIFYAGHGAPDVKEKMGYLIPQDGDPAYARETGFSLDEFYKFVGNIKADSVFVFLDACFSGKDREDKMIIADARPMEIVVKNVFLKNPSAVLFSSSGAGEISSSYPEKKHGLFTYFLLKGLRGDADKNSDKTLTIGELAEYLKVNVKETAITMDREQAPEVIGDLDKVMVRY